MAGASRDGSSTGPAEAAAPPPTPPSLGQYLSMDPLASGEPKHSRHGELRRALQADDPPEELRACWQGQVRSLQDAIQKLDRYKNIVTRRRQRSDSGADKPGAAPSPGSMRIGAQGSNSAGAMSKRVRSSLSDRRNNLVEEIEMRCPMVDIM